MEINIVLGDFLMEILVLIVLVAGAYWMWRKNAKKNSAVEEAPYKVEAPVAEVAPTVSPLGDTTSGGGPAVEVEAKPAKAPAKPRAKKPAAIKAKPKAEAKPKAPRKPKNLTVAK